MVAPPGWVDYPTDWLSPVDISDGDFGLHTLATGGLINLPVDLPSCVSVGLQPAFVNQIDKITNKN